MELPNRRELDAKVAKALSRLSSQHRRELVKLLGNPPSIDNVPAAFWDRVQQDTEEKLAALLLLIYFASSTHHGLDRSAAAELADKFAARRAADVAEKYTATSRERTENYSREWAERAKATGEPIPRTEVAERTVSVFGPERSAKVAVTEVTVAQTEGGETAAKKLKIASTEDKWKTNPHLSRSGPCPTCSPLHNKPRREWEKLFPDGPPIHDYCCCEIIYVNRNIVLPDASKAEPE